MSREAHAPFYESLGVRLLRATLPHVWVKSRKGRLIPGQLTAKDRMARAKKAINQQCRVMRHWSVRDQHQKLCRMLKGHFAYFGISGNSKRIGGLRFHAAHCWRKWLSRRSSKSRIPWSAFTEILKRFPLPLELCTAIPGGERICTMKNRMP